MLISKDDMVSGSIKLIDAYQLAIVGNSLYGNGRVWRVRCGHAFPYAYALTHKDALYIDSLYPPLSSFYSRRDRNGVRYDNAKKLFTLLNQCSKALTAT